MIYISDINILLFSNQSADSLSGSGSPAASSSPSGSGSATASSGDLEIWSEDDQDGLLAAAGSPL